MTRTHARVWLIWCHRKSSSGQELCNHHMCAHCSLCPSRGLTAEQLKVPEGPHSPVIYHLSEWSLHLLPGLFPASHPQSVSSYIPPCGGRGHPLPPQTTLLSCTPKCPLPPGQLRRATTTGSAPRPSPCSHRTWEQHSVTAENPGSGAKNAWG